VLVNASTWGLMLTGKLVQMNDATRADAPSAFKRLVGRVGEPVVRLAVRQAMKIMGHQFVMGRTISEALSRSHKGDNANYRYSFDMLGEGALTMKDALRYLEDYRRAIHAIGGDHKARAAARTATSTTPGHLDQAVGAVPALRARQARARAEGPGAGRAGTGAAGQELRHRLHRRRRRVRPPGTVAGHHRAGVRRLAGRLGRLRRGRAGLPEAHPYTIDHLADMARRAGRACRCAWSRAPTGMPRSSARRSEGYPATRCSPASRTPTCPTWPARKRLFTHADAIYPMFATHNAHTIAAVRSIANGGVYEHQKLHGMGDDLYAEVVPADRLGLPCRVYAPVGSHEDLLPYLVRRLLENGANSSFVNRITDERVPIADLIRDPVEMVASFASIPHPKIPLPVDLLRSQNHDRKNSMGANLANDNELRALAEQLNAAVKPWQAAPLVPGANPAGAALPVTNPADTREVVGQWLAADAATVQKALANAVAAQPAWNRTPAASRAAILEHAADQLEARMPSSWRCA
jgi:RHH-type proline utilization regulon transcriptional repressor/proline dehydrogenase/delta 1-pyrroline-5-carboxylate dehydrogenase